MPSHEQAPEILKEPLVPFFKNPNEEGNSAPGTLLSEDYLDYARRTVQKYFGPQPSGRGNAIDEDMVQAGYLGLVTAANEYNPDGEAVFKTTAFIHIKREVIDELRGRRFVKRKGYLKVRNWHEAEYDLAQRLQREPTKQEVAEKLGLSEEETEESVALLVHYPYSSLSVSPTKRKELLPLADIPDQMTYNEDEIIERIDRSRLAEAIHEKLEILTPHHQSIIREHFIESKPIAEIARERGVTFQAINQSKQLALQSLAKALQKPLDLAA